MDAMMERAHRGAAAARPQRLRGTLPFAGLLELTHDSKPKTVFVKNFDGPTCGFSCTEDGDFFSEGVEWKMSPDADHDLFITFVLLGDVKEIKPSPPEPSPEPLAEPLYCSGLFDGNGHARQMLSAKGEKATYSFSVVTTTGHHDPKIVITPQLAPQ